MMCNLHILFLVLYVIVQHVSCKVADISTIPGKFTNTKQKNTRLLKSDENDSPRRTKRQNFGNNFGGIPQDDKFYWGTINELPPKPPQFPGWNTRPNQQTKRTTPRPPFIITTTTRRPPRVTTTTRRPPGVTTTMAPSRRPAENDCTRRCFISPGVFNPVCGTDQITYPNPTRLRCAQTCFRNIQISHYGNCVYPGPPAPFPARD